MAPLVFFIVSEEKELRRQTPRHRAALRRNAPPPRMTASLTGNGFFGSAARPAAAVEPDDISRPVAVMPRNAGSSSRAGCVWTATSAATGAVGAQTPTGIAIGT